MAAEKETDENTKAKPGSPDPDKASQETPPPHTKGMKTHFRKRVFIPKHTYSPGKKGGWPR